MKNKYILLVFALFVVLNACEDFEALEKDPNRPVSVPPSLVLNGLLNDMYSAPWNDEQRWNQFWCINYNYYGTNEYTWTSPKMYFTSLKNISKMEEEALRVTGSEDNPYAALAPFFKAFFYVQMTQRMGDLPLSEALKPEEYKNPKYDEQKQIYMQVLQWLDEANTKIAAVIASNNTTLTGDFYLQNDLKKWQKVINTLTFRILIGLSKKETDADFNIKNRFSQLFSDPAKYPIMESMDDNLSYKYNNLNKYPISPDNYGFYATRYNMSATYLNTLALLRDPRTFIVAEPAPAKIKAGYTGSDFEAYVGARSGESLDDMSSKANLGEYSWISKTRYYSSYEGEPCIQIGYPELCFNIAEAINRGWVSGNAEDYYVKGIKASMGIYGITDEATLNTYLNQTEIKYSATASVALNQILLQKYLAFFQNSGMEAFFNQRRTGVPTFYTGPGTGNSARIPKRWQYPNSERTTNFDNYKKAIVDQGFGVTTTGDIIDDINTDLWLNK